MVVVVVDSSSQREGKVIGNVQMRRKTFYSFFLSDFFVTYIKMSVGAAEIIFTLFTIASLFASVKSIQKSKARLYAFKNDVSLAQMQRLHILVHLSAMLIVISAYVAAMLELYTYPVPILEYEAAKIVRIPYFITYLSTSAAIITSMAWIINVWIRTSRRKIFQSRSMTKLWMPFCLSLIALVVTVELAVISYWGSIDPVKSFVILQIIILIHFVISTLILLFASSKIPFKCIHTCKITPLLFI